jgi:hypothetical protein
MGYTSTLFRAGPTRIFAALVLSACGTVLPTPEDPPARTVDGTDADASTGVLQEAPIATDSDAQATTIAEAGAPKDLGQACTSGTECRSFFCLGDEATGTFCTIPCSMREQSDLVCFWPPLSGECHAEGFCKR